MSFALLLLASSTSFEKLVFTDVSRRECRYLYTSSIKTDNVR